MELRLTPEDRAFADVARRFIAEQLPAAVARASRLSPTVYAEYGIMQQWHRALAARGWAAPNWPRDYGGPGWSFARRYLWQIECARAAAPLVSPIGLSLVGPVVMHFGTAEQKQWVLPGILDGTHYWCQGFSEPGAGSDLAALRCRAQRDGDHYVVTGTKIWTTHAHYAQWMAALVRTADGGRRQDGISFLLIDMFASGVSVRPIRTIGGDHEVNQVFLDEVRVPCVQRVGAEGEGWAIAKFLLEFERGGDIMAPALRMAWADAVDIAAGRTGLAPVIDDADVAAAITHTGIDIDAFEMLELRVLSALESGGPPGAAASMLKLRASQLQQATAELLLRILGARALRWEARRPLYALDAAALGAHPVDGVAMPRYLNSRANTIFGGSSEIQRSLIARAVGL